ncbi:MAG: hypothetical protein KC427_10010 [Sulfurovum sp.]|uniref:hypothetical protein n=1 Tax=Sulfurovum sp. TaxID=1969726 RepID=UPI00286835EC|nr:hypothetical protein [Sulfurovum sp.]MCO4846338.1 hypothetical protein [Sulfurovum sp.]
MWLDTSDFGIPASKIDVNIGVCPLFSKESIASVSDSALLSLPLLPTLAEDIKELNFSGVMAAMFS